MKNQKSITGLSILFAVLSVSLTGCMTTVGVFDPYVNRERIKAEAFGDPETHTLAYGFVQCASPGSFTQLYYCQLNPQGDAALVIPGRKDGGFFFISPVPLDEYYAVAYYEFQFYAYIDSDFYCDCALVPDIPLNFTAKKPGLLYLGDYQLHYMKGDDRGFLETGIDREKEALLLLLEHCKGTAWEDVIIRRLRELKK